MSDNKEIAVIKVSDGSKNSSLNIIDGIKSLFEMGLEISFNSNIKDTNVNTTINKEGISIKFNK
jgi:hypothetical protein